jgi:hypothetical protein
MGSWLGGGREGGVRWRLVVREAVTLAGRADRARVARAFVVGVLGPGHPCSADAALLVSELFGNSLLHSSSGAPGETVTVAVRAVEDLVRVEVTDRSGRSPTPSTSWSASVSRSTRVPAADRGRARARPACARLGWSPPPAPAASGQIYQGADLHGHMAGTRPVHRWAILPGLPPPLRMTPGPRGPVAEDRGGGRRAAGVPGRLLPLAGAGRRPAARRRGAGPAQRAHGVAALARAGGR